VRRSVIKFSHCALWRVCVCVPSVSFLVCIHSIPFPLSCRRVRACAADFAQPLPDHHALLPSLMTQLLDKKYRCSIIQPFLARGAARTTSCSLERLHQPYSGDAKEKESLTRRSERKVEGQEGEAASAGKALQRVRPRSCPGECIRFRTSARSLSSGLCRRAIRGLSVHSFYSNLLVPAL